MADEQRQRRPYRVGPAVSTTAPARLLAKVYRRVERATADPESPLGAFLAGLPADQAIAGLNSIHLSLFGEIVRPPLNAKLIRQRAHRIRQRAEARKLGPPPPADPAEGEIL